jgi:hypothetical protein
MSLEEIKEAPVLKEGLNVPYRTEFVPSRDAFEEIGITFREEGEPGTLGHRINVIPPLEGSYYSGGVNGFIKDGSGASVAEYVMNMKGSGTFTLL